MASPCTTPKKFTVDDLQTLLSALDLKLVPADGTRNWQEIIDRANKFCHRVSVFLNPMRDLNTFSVNDPALKQQVQEVIDRSSPRDGSVCTNPVLHKVPEECDFTLDQVPATRPFDGSGDWVDCSSRSPYPGRLTTPVVSDNIGNEWASAGGEKPVSPEFQKATEEAYDKIEQELTIENIFDDEHTVGDHLDSLDQRIGDLTTHVENIAKLQNHNNQVCVDNDTAQDEVNRSLADDMAAIRNRFSMLEANFTGLTEGFGRLERNAAAAQSHAKNQIDCLDNGLTHQRQYISQTNERIDNLVDHVNKEIGVARDIPLHTRLEELNKAVVTNAKNFVNFVSYLGTLDIEGLQRTVKYLSENTVSKTMLELAQENGDKKVFDIHEMIKALAYDSNNWEQQLHQLHERTLKLDKQSLVNHGLKADYPLSLVIGSLLQRIERLENPPKHLSFLDEVEREAAPKKARKPRRKRSK